MVWSLSLNMRTQWSMGTYASFGFNILVLVNRDMTCTNCAGDVCFSVVRISSWLYCFCWVIFILCSCYQCHKISTDIIKIVGHTRITEAITTCCYQISKATKTNDLKNYTIYSYSSDSPGVLNIRKQHQILPLDKIGRQNK